MRLEANIGISDLREVAKVAKKTKCKIKILRKKGLPFIFNKYRKRKIFFVFLIFMNRYILKIKEFSLIEIISYGFLMGGVLGNLIDRVLVSGVIDYIGFQFGSYYYPIFNLADIFIVLGMVLIIMKEFGGFKNEHSRG